MGVEEMERYGRGYLRWNQVGRGSREILKQVWDREAANRDGASLLAVL